MPAPRIITGLAVPYNVVGRRGSQRYRFVPGSLTWPTTVWLLPEHHRAQRLGAVAQLLEGPGGLTCWARVRTGRAGDRALAQITSREVTGLSVGVDEQDVTRERGVLVVRRGILRDIALTKSPTFDDARATVATGSDLIGAEGQWLLQPAPM